LGAAVHRYPTTASRPALAIAVKTKDCAAGVEATLYSVVVVHESLWLAVVFQ